MRRKYEKPTLASERVFSLASQACDVKQTDGFCPSQITYEPCAPFSWKVQNMLCGELPPSPTTYS